MPQLHPHGANVTQLYGDPYGQPWVMQPSPILTDPNIRPFGGPWLPNEAQYGGPSRRQPVEYNHNKVITKKLANAVHYQQVLDIVAESVNVFDEVNVATALHRLAKLQPPASAGQASPVIYADHFQQLVVAIKRQLQRFEAQAISNTLWAFATLNYYPDEETLSRLASHAQTIIQTFRPQATSNTLWAFAKLGFGDCEGFLVAAAQQMLNDLPRSVPQDISNTMWAYATLGYQPGQELMTGAARQAALLMQRCKPQEIANTLWAYAMLDHDPGSGLLDAVATQMTERIQNFRPQAVSNSLWAYAKLEYNPGSRLLDITAQRATGMLHQYTSQEIANTLWAMATLEHHPSAMLLDAAAVQIVRRIEQFSPVDTVRCASAFATLYHHPCNDLLAVVAHYALRNWSRFTPNEVASLIWALALLRLTPLDNWQALLDKLSTMPATDFETADLRLLFQAHTLLSNIGAGVPGSPSAGGQQLASAQLAAGFSLPPALLEPARAAWVADVRRSGRLTKLHEEVSRVLWRMGVLHRSDHVMADGLVCVHMALDGDKVVLEVDDASHYAVNAWRPLGRTLARRYMLEALGLTVRSIPFYQWFSLGDLENQKAFLTQLLATLPSPTAQATPSSAAPMSLTAQPLQQNQPADIL
ncbi:hypothetical protein WJX73_002051 [Symbiochloris irregularis]|uniref:RAP domain-containing protein n=1 Tax=Symbiochloris irregularis TaxID=706552 RepID=A0AAW1Q3Y3_9CHLO